MKRTLRNQLLRSIWCIPIVLLLTGCGGSDRPETGEVSGVVTLDGEPLPDARVVFSPEAGGQSSEATTDNQGRYALVYRGDEMGAKVGQHKVIVSTFEESWLDDSGEPTGGREELVPGNYNTKSELLLDVEPGTNDIPLDLQSSKSGQD